MAEHLIAYVHQEFITYWKQLSLYKPDGNLPKFLYSCNGSGQFKDYAKGNATLWVVATRASEPPALVAKLNHVLRVGEEIRQSQVAPDLLKQFAFRDHVSIGGTGSHFFAHNDVSQLLFDMKFLNVNGQVWQFPRAGRDSDGRWLWNGRRNGNYLSNPFRVASGVLELRDYAAAIRNRSVFISYKRRDHRGTEKKLRLEKFIRQLILLGYSVWFDRIALPGSRVAKEGWIRFGNNQQKAMLTAMLDYGIKNCSAIISISSRRYGRASSNCASNWTLTEYRKATRTRKRAVWGLYERPDSEVVIDPREVFSHSGSPRQAAIDFDRWFKRALR